MSNKCDEILDILWARGVNYGVMQKTSEKDASEFAINDALSQLAEVVKGLEVIRGGADGLLSRREVLRLFEEDKDV